MDLVRIYLVAAATSTTANDMHSAHFALYSALSAASKAYLYCKACTCLSAEIHSKTHRTHQVLSKLRLKKVRALFTTCISIFLTCGSHSRYGNITNNCPNQ